MRIYVYSLYVGFYNKCKDMNEHDNNRSVADSAFGVILIIIVLVVGIIVMW